MTPYSALDTKHFWSPSVGSIEPLEIEQLWNPKRLITKRHKISSYGSCFAQHFGNALAKRNYQWMQYETPPEGLSLDNQKTFNYGVFSARTANIYTTSLLRQWTEWSLGITEVPSEVWVKDGRFYDPFRPAIEPNGFASEEEVHQSRLVTLEAFKKSFTDANLFVFTLGLTESWRNTNGYEYPMCPGTVAGEFNEKEHVFHNHKFNEVKRDLIAATRLMVKANPKLRFLLTVSPVPLTATMSGKHVLTATVESKSILRAVAGEIANNNLRFDYFPSFEIINSSPFQGMFYNENKRTVRMEGVDFVMSSFFNCMDEHFPGNKQKPKVARNNNVTQIRAAKRNVGDDPVCEEELLDSFSPENNTRSNTGQ